MIRALLKTLPWRLVVLTSMAALLAVFCRAQWPESAAALMFALVSVACGATALVCTLRAVDTKRPIASNESVAPATSIPSDPSDDRAKSLPEGRSLPPAPAEIAVRFPVMLATLEDIGRLVSMNLDLDTLVPAIISTAKTSLRCDRCSVYLWDAARQVLINPLDLPEQLDAGFVPHAASGIGAWVLRERTIWTRACRTDDANQRAESEFAALTPDAVAPLTAGGDLLGLLVVEHTPVRPPHLEQMLNTLANIYGLGIKNAQLFRRVEEMARRDGLTGLYNHTTFQEELRTLVLAAAAEQTPLSLVMSDIDDFKGFNDRFGHQIGDDVLREFARLWSAALPDSAIVARYGGEEFIAALPGVDRDGAVELAEFLRNAVQVHPFFSNGHDLQVTASFGVAELDDGMHTADDLVRVADQCLYAAKKGGRNRVATLSTCVGTRLGSDR